MNSITEQDDPNELKRSKFDNRFAIANCSLTTLQIVPNSLITLRIVRSRSIHCKLVHRQEHFKWFLMKFWWSKVDWKSFVCLFVCLFVAGRPLGCFSSRRRFLVSKEFGFRGPRFSHHWSSHAVFIVNKTSLVDYWHPYKPFFTYFVGSIRHLCCVTSLRTRLTCDIDLFIYWNEPYLTWVEYY